MKHLEGISIFELSESIVSKSTVEILKKAIEVYGISYPEYRLRYFAYVIENGNEEDLQSLPAIVKRAWKHYCEKVEKLEEIELEEQQKEKEFKRKLLLEKIKKEHQQLLNDRRSRQSLINCLILASIALLCLLCVRYLLNDPIFLKVIEWIIGR